MASLENFNVSINSENETSPRNESVDIQETLGSTIVNTNVDPLSSQHLYSLSTEPISAPLSDISCQIVQIAAECSTTNSEPSAVLMSTHNASVSEGTIQECANLDHVSQLDEKFENNEKKELVTANTKGSLLKSVRKPRKTQMMEALSVPLHLEKSARMMKMMGYQGGPLGVRGEGITEPIKPALDRMNGAGLGYERGARIPNQRGKNIGSGVRPSHSNPPQTGNARNGTSKGYRFMLVLLRSAITLMTSEVDKVRVPYNQKHKRKKYFVKTFFETVNDGLNQIGKFPNGATAEQLSKFSCNFDFKLQEAADLAHTLKTAMENSPWMIHGSETSDRQMILKKMPSDHESKPKKSNLAPRHAITSQYEPNTEQDNVCDNNMATVFITDKRLNYYVNNVSFPNVDGYPQSCTFSLAFRLILLDDILEFSKSDKTSIAIDLGAMVDKNEFHFVFNLCRGSHTFETKMENDTYADISFVMFNRNLYLDIEYGSQRSLIVQKLPDTPENRRKSGKRLRAWYSKNNDSDPEHVTTPDEDMESITSENARNGTSKGYRFKLVLLRSAITLMTSEVDEVRVPYNQKHKRKKYFVKTFFDTVNDGCNFNFKLQEAADLAHTLKTAMENSPWMIHGSETTDRQMILKKVPSDHESKPKKSNLAPRHAITSQDETKTEQNSVCDNNTS